MQKHFRGDIGLFRAALLLAGFIESHDCTMFNDDSKAKATRRLKLWFGNGVFNSPKEQQQALAVYLHKAFGERITKM